MLRCPPSSEAGEPPGLAPKGPCPANPLQEARDWFPGVGGRGVDTIPAHNKRVRHEIAKEPFSAP